ncbi:SbcC/MukB-like Walker B domain-containing protein [Candidatus Dependentiae bacterium]
MIPLTLQVKNFLSYGSDTQTIDFSPYQLICLSGKNGHGKSALLDAITWAVWGQARKVSGAPKADANLLKLGQTQMMVCLDFLCNGQIYRVRREYTKTYGKPVAALDFGILNQKENTVTPLTDKTIRATQQKIEQTIRLTFEAFTNSAFLRQGQANEFSKKSPKDRKEIFAQILGLQQYEDVRKLAMERAKDAVAKKTGLNALQEKIEAELSRVEQLDQEINDLEKNLKKISQQEKSLDQDRKKLKADKAALAEEQKKKEMLLFQLKELQQKKTEQQKNLQEIKTEWEAIQKQRLELADQKTLEEKKKHLLNAIDQHQKKLQLSLNFKEKQLNHSKELHNLEKTFYEQQLATAQEKKVTLERLHLTIEAIEKNINERETQANEKNKALVQLQQEIATSMQQTEKAAGLKEALTKQDKHLLAGKEQYQQLVAEGNVTKKQLADLLQKEKLSHDENNPSCPLCEQNLSASRKRFLRLKFTQQKEELHLRLETLTTQITKLKKKLIEKHTSFEQQKKKSEENTKLILQMDELKKSATTYKKELESAKQNTKKEKTRLQSIKKEYAQAQEALKKHKQQGEKKLQENARYVQLSNLCKEMNDQLKQLEYDQQKHAEDTSALKKIEDSLEQLHKLREQITLQTERKKQIDHLEHLLGQIKKQEELLEKETKHYQSLAQKETTLHQQEQQLNVQKERIQKEKETLLQKKGALENQKEKLKQLKTEYQKQKKAVDVLNQQADDYYEIAAATSKNGIQALLIENAIPEVEQEANRLLSKLTSNNAQIFIESLRDLKKGGTKETLDIKISDAAGIRPYELFSGGEAFRIDFALRIAISKLLARRAGTALQTLIIDEGFGSQDEEGLSQIMEAIHKIQEDFLKVIVVSHLTSMKDQFPVHFVVEKDATGSKVSVFELG